MMQYKDEMEELKQCPYCGQIAMKIYNESPLHAECLSCYM